MSNVLKVLLIGLFLGSMFFLSGTVNAQAPGADGESLKNVKDVIGTITPPQELNDIVNNPDGTRRNPNEALGLVISNIVRIIYSLAGLIFLFMLIIGAIQWMTSGGNKESLQSAQKRLMAAIVGFILLALAALIANIIARTTGFDPILI